MIVSEREDVPWALVPGGKLPYAPPLWVCARADSMIHSGPVTWSGEDPPASNDDASPCAWVPFWAYGRVPDSFNPAKPSSP